MYKHNSEARNSSEVQVYLEIHLLPHRQAESSQYKGKPVRAAQKNNRHLYEIHKYTLVKM